MTRLLLLAVLCLSPLASPPALAADDPVVLTSLAELPKPDGKAIEALLEKFFTPLRETGPESAVEAIKTDAPFDLSPLLPQFQRLTDLAWAGPPEDYEIVRILPLGARGRFYEVRVLTYHRQGLAGWRFKFYKTTEDRWVFSAMELQSTYVRELMELRELEYDAMRE